MITRVRSSPKVERSTHVQDCPMGLEDYLPVPNPDGTARNRHIASVSFPDPRCGTGMRPQSSNQGHDGMLCTPQTQTANQWDVCLYRLYPLQTLYTVIPQSINTLPYVMSYTRNAVAQAMGSELASFPGSLLSLGTRLVLNQPLRPRVRCTHRITMQLDMLHAPNCSMINLHYAMQVYRPGSVVRASD